MSNTTSGALSIRQANRVQQRMGAPFATLPHSSAFTALMRHGGLAVLLDQKTTVSRLAPFLAGADAAEVEMSPETIAQQIETAAQNFFRKLVNRPGYQINADLISYLTFPHEGQAFENTPTVSADLPAVFTFVGQFIDHDLTMNAMDLFLDQTGPVRDGASPLIDLDSVYGPRSTGAGAGLDMIFDAAGKFKLRAIPGTTGFDLERTPMPTAPGQIPHLPTPQVAHIFDSRNDENQLVLQIHILLERVHNKLVDQNTLNTSGMTKDQVIATVRKEVVANWQTVVLQDYLQRVIETNTLTDVLGQVRQVNFGNLKHKPILDLASGALIVQLPHEWAIGFRFGHSQLRPEYHLNNWGGNSVKLFDNYSAQPGIDDLRGSVELPKAHLIDWSVFFPDVNPIPHHTRSLRIDSKVTPPVFNLPESAIPDNVKTVGNLPQRNLIRSRSIGVVSGEELFDFYTSADGGPAVTLHGSKLTPNQVAPSQVHHLFMHDAVPGSQPPVPVFKTPLWYYIIKEAELQGNSRTLGAVGSRLVAEVVAGAVFYDPESVYFNPNYKTAPDPNAGAPVPIAANWTSAITHTKMVTLRHLIEFATT